MLIRSSDDIIKQFLLVWSSSVDASAFSTARNILGQALVDVDLAKFPDESSSSAIALEVSD